MSNGGLIGVVNNTTSFSASGLWSQNDAFLKNKEGVWPPGLIQDGLTVWLEPSLISSYPGSGSTAYNLAGSPNATFVNNTSFSSLGNGSFAFDGNGDYLSLGNLGSFYSSGTISFWMYSTSVSNYRNPFTTKLDGSNAGIRFEQNDTGLIGVVVGNDAGTYGGYAIINSGGLVANVWRHICITWNTSTNMLYGYADGQQSLSQSHSYWATVLPNVVIGRGFSADSARHFAGNIGQFLMYNRDLSAEEVAFNYSKGLITLDI